MPHFRLQIVVAGSGAVVSPDRWVGRYPRFRTIGAVKSSSCLIAEGKLATPIIKKSASSSSVTKSLFRIYPLQVFV